jgi:hypothetical protein
MEMLARSIDGVIKQLCDRNAATNDASLNSA